MNPATIASMARLTNQRLSDGLSRMHWPEKTVLLGKLFIGNDLVHSNCWRGYLLCGERNQTRRDETCNDDNDDTYAIHFNSALCQNLAKIS